MRLEANSTRPVCTKRAEHQCRRQFTVTVGTVFDCSRVLLNMWLLAAYPRCSSKKGISAHQLHQMLGVPCKTVWFMAHRIRQAMTEGGDGLLGSGGGTVKGVETFWGTTGAEGHPRKDATTSSR